MVEKPPFDEPGVVQEFVGEGVTREFEALKRASDFSRKTVGEFIESAEEMIGPVRESYKIRYTLLVRSASGTNISKRGAKARARAFTRAKNPFEPDFVHVRSAEIAQGISGAEVMGRDIGTVFRVETEVSK